MSYLNTASVVSQQYQDDRYLSVRIALHKKYSTNKYGYANWIFDRYEFTENCKILELGCGNGDMWDGRIPSLPVGCDLLLSDISFGMVKIVQDRFSKYSNVTAKAMDIQDILYSDQTFDIVIANSMLYHVPDLPKAISEVYRVLKPGGKFYAATLGNHGMHHFFYEKLHDFNPAINAFKEPFSFNLENGKEILGKFFTCIKMYEYENSLEITEISDLINWILSTTLMSRINKSDLSGLDEYFEKCKDSKGIIKIPKQAGMFTAVK